jgi:peptidyl-tRNA hydrolase
VRLGIGRPMTEQGVPVKGDAVSNFVLSPFASGDKAWLEPLITAVASGFDQLLEGNFSEFAARLPR